MGHVAGYAVLCAYRAGGAGVFAGGLGVGAGDVAGEALFVIGGRIWRELLVGVVAGGAG